jgi:DNA polymerase-3 subunit beta
MPEHEPLQVDRDALRTGLARVRLETAARGICPVHLEATGDGRLHLGADAGDGGAVEASVEATGALPPTYLYLGALAKLADKWKPGPVRLESDGKRLAITTGRSTAELLTIPPERYPRRPALRNAHERIDLSETWPGIQRVLKAADAREEAKVAWLKDVVILGGYAYATDKYRIHRVAVGATEAIRVPGPALTTAVRAGAEVCALVTDGNRFELVAPDTTWVGSLAPMDEVLKAAPMLAKPFDFRPTTRMAVKRADLLEGLAEALALDSETNTVVLEAEPGQLTVKRVGKDVGKAARSMDATCTGPTTVVGFTPDYLVGSLKSITAETVVLEGTTELAVWRFRDETMDVAVMPKKL